MYQARTNKTAMHRVAVLFVCIIIIFLGFRWRTSAMPEKSPHVGEAASLSDNVFAVITLNKSLQRLDLIKFLGIIHNYETDKGISHFEPNQRTILVLKNGSLSTIPSNERSKYITNASRAPGWFWPTYIGSVNYLNGKKSQPLVWRPHSIRMALDHSEKTINSSWINSMRGYHLNCSGKCAESGDSRLPESSVLNDSDIFHTNDEQIVIHFPVDTDESEIFAFLARSVQISQPSIEHKRLADGTPYSELVPSTDVAMSTNFLDNTEITTIKSGDFSWHTLRSSNGIIASTSLESLVERLSTPLLTNKACGKTPVWFMTLVSSPMSATNQLSLVRSKHHLILCNQK